MTRRSLYDGVASVTYFIEKMRTIVLLIITLTCLSGIADTLKVIRLPAPIWSGGKPLMQALKERHTSRDFQNTPLPDQMLSNLLWAAFGINRPALQGRTAPSSHDAQEIDIYVVMAHGTYRYNAQQHALNGVREGDLRASTGIQPFAKDAPVSLVYVADFSKFSGDSDADKHFYAAADAGHISENVYLFSASENLAVMVRAYIDKPALSKALGLAPHQHIMFAQSVGYPK